MQRDIRKYIGVAALAAVMVIAACARQGFPPGGPEDKTPPELATVTPEPLTPNVPTGTSVIFEFSKPMSKRTVEDNLFIVPIPAEWPRISWRNGDRVMILDFPKPLRENATHVITIGSKASDQHSNMLRNSIILKFSTGPRIENGEIRGRVIPWRFFGPSPENPAGVDVVAYSMADSARMPDPRNDVPDYVTQTNADGTWSLVGLSSGRYRLFAIGDKDRNGFYSEGYDMIGVASHDVSLALGDTLALAPQMVVSEMDSALVQFMSVRPADKNRVELFFDSEIDPGTVKFSIEGLDVPGWFVLPGDLRKISAATSAQTEGKEYRVTGLSLRDRDGNPLAPVPKPPVFAGVDRADTTALEILEWEPKVLTPGKDPIQLLFNRVLAVTDTTRSVIADASGEKVSVRRTGANRMEIYPSENWRDNTNYRIAFDRETLRGAAGNQLTGPGSQLAFRVVPADTLGIMTGMLADPAGTGNSLYRLVFRNLESGVQKQMDIRGSQAWNSGGVLPGRYVALGFRDDDGDGQITRGKAAPYHVSEPVYAYPDTITVVSRRTTKDLTFRFQ